MNDKLKMKPIFMMAGLGGVLFASIQSADAAPLPQKQR